MSATANRTDTTYTFGVITPEEFDRLPKPQARAAFSNGPGRSVLPRFVGMKPNALACATHPGNLVAGCVILYLNGRFGADGSVYFGPIGISDDPALLRAINRGDS